MSLRTKTRCRVDLRSTGGLLVALALCTGASECPLTVGDNAAGSGSNGAPVALAESSGSIWEVRTDRTLRVTLRAGDRAASVEAEAERGSATLLGQPLAIGDFCWRADAICPHQVLPDQLNIAQSNQVVAVTFNRRGPLAELGAATALGGQLVGNDLAIPLNVGAAAQGSCALLFPSAVIASALPDPNAAVSDGPSRATSMQGRITVRYSGLCLTLGGSAALGVEDTVELSAAFTASRR